MIVISDINPLKKDVIIQNMSGVISDIDLC